MRAPFASLVAGALAAASAACGSPCQDLADRICGCVPIAAGGSVSVPYYDPNGLRDSCKASVKNQLGSGAQQPTQADQAFCQQKLQTCADPTRDASACERLQSPQGKVDCGLAYPPPTATPAPTPPAPGS